MTVSRNDSQSKPSAGRILARTLIAAVGAVAVNQLYALAYTALTGFSIPEVINPISISLFSAVPIVVGGVIYWGASRFRVGVANWGLAVGTVILFALFAIPSFADTIQRPGAPTIPAPDGFAGLSFGLHFAGPILLLWLVPAWRRTSAPA